MINLAVILSVFLISFISLATNKQNADEITETARKHLLRQITALANKSDYSKRSKIPVNNELMQLSFNQRHASCIADYLDVSEIMTKNLQPLQKAIRLKDYAAIHSLGLPLQLTFAGPGNLSDRSQDGVKEIDWDAPQSLKTYFSKFRSIEHTELRVVNFQVVEANRLKDHSFAKVAVLLKLDIRGRDRMFARRHDSAEIQARLIKKQGKWRFESLRTRNGLTVAANRTPYFADVTQSSNLAQVPVYLRTEAIRRGGYALSINDFNGDGIQDIFVGLRDEAQMWQGKANGKFEKVLVGLEQERYAKTAVFADYDNDGDQDVIINRFVNKSNKEMSPDVDVIKYTNDGKGKFHIASVQFGDADSLREPMPAAVADFTKDGFLDFYVGYPGVRDFSAFYNAEDPAKNVQGLYVNNRKGGFQDFTKTHLNHGTDRDYDLQVFPHSSLAIDFDQDGDSDLLVIDDRGNLSPIYQNLGDGKMRQNADQVGLANYGFGMTATSGDLNNDGITDLALTNVHFDVLDALGSTCEMNWKTPLPLYRGNQARGLMLYQGIRKGRFSEVSKLVGVGSPGEATGGVTFIDYNNDGLQDIYISNGLWSGTKDGQELSALFALLLGNHGMRYGLRQSDSFKFMDLLANMRGTFSDFKDLNKIQPAESSPSFGGYQRNRLYRNNGDGTFTDVSYLEQVDSVADGYIVGKADINRDGKLDLVLRNADPGTRYVSYPPVQVFMNQSPSKQAVRISFTGTKSNRDAIGLFAVAHIGDHKMVQHLEGNSGSLQQERVLHYGLGSNATIDRLEIHWPSGLVETKTNIKAGSYHFTEPEGKANIFSKR